MTDIDDSALFHGGVYDPAKAHAYYLRTRKLKGRRQGSGKQSSGGQKGSGKSAAPARNKARRQQLQAEKKKLEARLDKLKYILEQLVSDAKKRSGVKNPDSHKSGSSTTTTSKKSKSSDSASEPLTRSEKNKKNREARTEYAKENKGPTLSQDLETLRRQIDDIRQQIHAAMEKDRQKHGGEARKSTSKTAPKGR